jgi:transposase
MNIHKNAQLTFVRRLEMVLSIVEQKCALVWAAAQAGVSEPTARKWLGRYLAEGEQGLKDRSSRPQCSPRSIAAQKALAIVELRRRRLTQARIAQAMGLSKRTVGRVLRRAGLSRLRDLEPSEPLVRYEHEHPATRPSPQPPAAAMRVIDVRDRWWKIELPKLGGQGAYRVQHRCDATCRRARETGRGWHAGREESNRAKDTRTRPSGYPYQAQRFDRTICVQPHQACHRTCEDRHAGSESETRPREHARPRSGRVGALVFYDVRPAVRRGRVSGPGVLMVFQGGEPVQRAPELHLGLRVPSMSELSRWAGELGGEITTGTEFASFRTFDPKATALSSTARPSHD